MLATVSKIKGVVKGRRQGQDGYAGHPKGGDKGDGGGMARKNTCFTYGSLERISKNCPQALELVVIFAGAVKEEHIRGSCFRKA